MQERRDARQEEAGKEGYRKRGTPVQEKRDIVKGQEKRDTLKERYRYQVCVKTTRKVLIKQAIRVIEQTLLLSFFRYMYR